MSKDIENYIVEMGGSRTLFEQMMIVNSSNLHILSDEEFESLIGENDAATEEWLVSKCGNVNPNHYEIDLLRDWRKHTRHNSSISDRFLAQRVLSVDPDVLASAIMEEDRNNDCKECFTVQDRNKSLGLPDHACSLWE